MKITLIILLSFCSVWANGQPIIFIKNGVNQDQIARKTSTKKNSQGADTTKWKTKTNSLSQNSEENDTLEIIARNIPETGNQKTILKIDTLNLSLNSNEELSLPIDANRFAKIILVKEKKQVRIFPISSPNFYFTSWYMD